MLINPFPGPQPYRASDRRRFYGRDDLSHRIASSIGANLCVKLYGPSGAGKSSLLQASVLPKLVESSDARVVRVDGFPDREDPARSLAAALYAELAHGELPMDVAAPELVVSCVKRAARASPRLVVIVLDQLEQLLHADRDPSTTNAFFECLDDLLILPFCTLRLVLSLREDYLGRFQERLQQRERLLKHEFRVGPLTVAELTDSVCLAAAAGTPPQVWSTEEIRALVLQVRAPGRTATDEAETQAAHAQIVCRALFQIRAQGNGGDHKAIMPETILREYLDVTLSSLGPLRNAAERLLEEHLVTLDGGRTLRTESELNRFFPPDDLSRILGTLEAAAILHAEAHQGGRYFEISHDSLARKVFKRRREREDEIAWREIEEQTARAALETQEKPGLMEPPQVPEEEPRALARARRQRRLDLGFAAICLSIAAISTILWLDAWTAKREVEAARQKAEERACPSNLTSPSSNPSWR